MEESAASSKQALKIEKEKENEKRTFLIGYVRTVIALLLLRHIECLIEFQVDFVELQKCFGDALNKPGSQINQRFDVKSGANFIVDFLIA